jgi:tyrosine-protein phosphatase
MCTRLIYQLRDYEKVLKRGTEPSPHDSDVSSIAEDEEEWTRRRRLLDEAPDDEPNERESVSVMQEAKALDKAMEDRIVARKSSASSMSSIGSSSGFGMGSTWRSHFPRKRKGSTTSNNTTGSSLSETLVEEEEEQELLGIGGGFDNDSHQSQTEEDSSLGSCSPDDDQKGTPRNVSVLNSNLETLNPPASLAWKATPFPSGPPLTAIRSTFDISPSRPSPPKSRVKRRPVSLSILPPVPASPINLVLESDGGVSRGNHLTYQDDNAHIPSRFPHPPTRRRSESRLLHPSSLRQSLLLQKGSSGSVSTRSSSSDSVSSVCASQTQTLIVFPPSPTTTPKNLRTPVPAPSTMTLLSNPSGPVAFPSLSMLQTPLVSTFNGSYSSGNTTSAATTTKAKRRSFIGLTTPSTPTVGLAKVDARGYVGFENFNSLP